MNSTSTQENGVNGENVTKKIFGRGEGRQENGRNRRCSADRWTGFKEIPRKSHSAVTENLIIVERDVTSRGTTNTRTAYVYSPNGGRPREGGAIIDRERQTLIHRYIWVCVCVCAGPNLLHEIGKQ